MKSERNIGESRELRRILRSGEKMAAGKMKGRKAHLNLSRNTLTK